MAKNKETKEKKLTAKEVLNSLKDQLGEDNKLLNNIHMADEELLEIKEYIDTGSYSLNKIISGDPRKGIPVGRVTALAGEPSTGKSFICKRLIKNAVNSDFMVIVIDSEDAYHKKELDNDGINTEQVIIAKKSTITEVKNEVIPLLRTLREKLPDQKFLIILDSLAALATEKQLGDDIEAGKVGHDQGMKAKDMKLLSTVFMQEIKRLKLTMVVTNHIYLKPGQNPSMPPEQIFTGGSGWIYACSVIVFLRKKQDKEEIKDAREFSQSTTVKTQKQPSGMFIIGNCKKNRFIPEGYESETYISFKAGLNKWYGLADDAAEFGYIEKTAGWVFVKHLDKKVREGDLYKSDVWNPIFNELCDKIYDKLKFKPLKEITESEQALEVAQDQKE